MHARRGGRAGGAGPDGAARLPRGAGAAGPEGGGGVLRLHAGNVQRDNFFYIGEDKRAGRAMLLLELLTPFINHPPHISPVSTNVKVSPLRFAGGY